MVCAATYFGAYILGKLTQFEMFFNPDFLMYMGGIIYANMINKIDKIL